MPSVRLIRKRSGGQAGWRPESRSLTGQLEALLTCAAAGLPVAATTFASKWSRRWWADRVQLTGAKYAGPWELPVLGAVTAPAAVVIRPDGYVAWAGELTHQGSLTR